MLNDILDRIAEAVLPLNESQEEAQRKALMKYVGRVTTYREELESRSASLQRKRKYRFIIGAVALTLFSLAGGYLFLFHGGTLHLPIFAMMGMMLFVVFSCIALLQADPLRMLKKYSTKEKKRLDEKLNLIKNGDERRSWEKGLEMLSDDLQEIGGKIKKADKSLFR